MAWPQLSNHSSFNSTTTSPAGSIKRSVISCALPVIFALAAFYTHCLKGRVVRVFYDAFFAGLLKGHQSSHLQCARKYQIAAVLSAIDVNKFPIPSVVDQSKIEVRRLI
jgi:hypothetical protein